MGELDWIAGIGAIGSIATAVGVGIAAWQLKVSRKLATTRFEDGLVQQYRDLLHHIPVDALLGASLDTDVQSKHLDDFYRYFDLCNEQAFLRQQKRVSETTWRMWADGIQKNMNRPAFSDAWSTVKGRCDGEFRELRWLENENFQPDPKNLPRQFDAKEDSQELRQAA